MSGPVLLARARDIPHLPVDAFLDGLRADVAAGARPVSLWARPADGGLLLTAVVAAPALRVTRTTIDPARGWRSLTADLPRFHALEREVWEQTGAVPHGHPWLKPVRFPRGGMQGYPFYAVEGKEVHEVQVGPIHAGVIEPGAFRFMCHGEEVHHLEVHLGYQHRGVERLLLTRPLGQLPGLVESIAGDTSVGYALGHARAVEALRGRPVRPEVELVRGVALELERIAMHLVGLAGLATDVAFLPAASTYGRLRTGVINLSQRIAGNRFGRGWLRPGGARAGVDREAAAATREVLDALERDVAGCDDLFFSARSVRHRLRGAGVVTEAVARTIGLVGPSARASNVPLDLRADLPCPAHARLPVTPVVEPDGDCWARARLRARELDASLRWIRAALEVGGGTLPGGVEPPGPLEPGALCVSLVEGWRGEVVQALETDAGGRLLHYRVQDPSLGNWMGLAMAVRGNPIYDFPICNKSFDLSYCGNDL